MHSCVSFFLRCRFHSTTGNKATASSYLRFRENNQNIASRDEKEKDATFVLSIYGDDKNKVDPFLWNGKNIVFKVVSNNILKIFDPEGKELVVADLHKFDYIGRIHVLQIALGDSESKGLAVLVRLRATSRRSMLLIYDATAKLLYEELLNRTDDNGMNLLVDESGKEYLYVDVDSPVVYSIALK